MKKTNFQLPLFAFLLCANLLLPNAAVAQTNPLEQYLGKAAPILQNINIAKTFETIKNVFAPPTATTTPTTPPATAPTAPTKQPENAIVSPTNDPTVANNTNGTGKNTAKPPVEPVSTNLPNRGKGTPTITEQKPTTGKPTSTGNGSTNWSEGYIEATGRCFLSPEKFTVPGQAEELCKEGAKVMARRNLLALTKEVRIIDTVTLLNQMFDRQVTYQILDGWVRGSEQVGDYTITPYYVEVKMRMPLYKGSGSVASVAAQSIGQNPNAAPLFRQMMPENTNTTAAPTAAAMEGLRNDMLAAGVTLPADGSLPMVLNTRTTDGSPVQPSLFPSLKINMPDGSVQTVNLAQYFPNMQGGGDFPRYFQASKDVLTSLNGKNIPVLDMIQAKDGSFSVDIAKIPQSTKFGKFMKDFGKVALDVLKVAAHIIL
jgi:hypothetical protein